MAVFESRHPVVVSLRVDNNLTRRIVFSQAHEPIQHTFRAPLNSGVRPKHLVLKGVKHLGVKVY